MVSSFLPKIVSMNIQISKTEVNLLMSHNYLIEGMTQEREYIGVFADGLCWVWGQNEN